MNPETAELLRDPKSGARIVLEQAPGGQTILKAEGTGRRIPLIDQIPSFLDQAEVTGPNLKFQAMYDRLAIGYDLAEWIGGFFWGGRENARLEILADVIPHARGKVLEVSIGTGANLRYLPKDAQYYGLDISMGMLRKCRRNLRRWGISAELIHASAEKLPFADQTFDMVLHFGGINFFTDPAAAAMEMARVAKPGAFVFFGDETEELIKVYQKSLFFSGYFKTAMERVFEPLSIVPAGMACAGKKLMRNGKLYMVSFQKPF